MSGFSIHEGVAAPIRQDNVDTDQIIPSREMKRVSKEGLGDGLFAGWRYLYADGEKARPNPDFVLNQPAFAGATILLGGRNFGCGSSREHAVWALADFGIRVIIAASFGRIFRANCARNRLLALTLSAADIEAIDDYTAEDPQGRQVSVDLERLRVRLDDGREFAFEIDEFDRGMLLAGLDYIDFSLRYEDDIDAFVRRDRLSRPWAHL